MPRLLAVVTLLALAGCRIDPPRDNPLDPKNPNALPGSIAGTVSFDETGTALADVPLTSVNISVDNSAPVTPDSTGAFVAGNLRPGTHQVVISAPYSDPVQLDGVEVLPNQEADGGTVTLVRGRGRFAGKIKLYGVTPGGPIDYSGTRVVVSDHPAGQPRVALTDPEGVFEIGDVAAGKRDIQIRRDGYAPAQINDEDLLPGQRKDIGEYTLGSGSFSATVSGTILLEGFDPPSSEYTSARVTLSGGVASAAVGADGRFTINSPLGGTFDVVATKDGYEPAEARDVFLQEGSPVTLPGVLTLRKARGAAKGEVAVSGGGNDGVRVCVQGDESACATSTIPTRPDGGTLGAFRIENVPSGQVVQLVATKDEGIRTYFGLSAPRAVTPGPATDFGTIVLAYSGGDFRLRGRVYNPSTNQMESSQDTTREPWVAVDLSSVNTSGFTYVSRSFDGTFSTWLPLGSPQAPDCADPANQTATTPLCVRVPAEGLQTLRLMLSDQPGGGGRTLGPIQGAILYDATPPTGVTLTLNGGAAWINAQGGTTINAGVAAADAHSALRFLRLAAASAPATPDLAAAGTLAFTPAPSPIAIPDYPAEGAKSVAVRVYDAAGNSADAQASIGLDRTVPSGVGVRITDANAQGYVRFGLVTVELDRGPAGGAGADVARVQISNSPTMAFPTDVGFVPDGTGRLMLAPWALLAGAGPRTVYAVFIDPAGNPSLPAQATVIVDPVPPTEPVLLLDENPCPPAARTDTLPNGFTRNTSVCVTVIADPDTDHLEVRGCTALRPPGVNQFQCDLSNVTDGAKTISAVAMDPAGNASGGAQVAIQLDRTPPPVPVLNMLRSQGAAPASVTPDKFVNSQIVVYQVTPSPGEVAELVLDQTAPVAANSGWFPWSLTGLYILANAQEGTHRVRARLRDLAENESASFSVDDTVILDQTRPGTPVATPAVPELTNLSTTLTRTLGGPSIDQNFWHFEISGSQNCPSGCTTQALVNPVSQALELTPNALRADIIRIAARDLAGNLGPDLVTVVTHDSAPPEAPALSTGLAPVVNADLLTLPLNGRPRDPATGTGADHFSGLEALVLTGSPPPACDPMATGWVPAATLDSVTVGLNQNASNRICVRARDGAGNVSAISERIVDEDSLPPGTPVMRPPAPSVNADATFFWFYDPPPADAAALVTRAGAPFDQGNHFSHFEVLGGPFSTWTCLPGSYDPGTRTWPAPSTCSTHVARDMVEIPLLQNRENVFYVRGVDKAGNVGPPSTAVTVAEQSIFDLGLRGQNTLQSPRVHGNRAVWLDVSGTTTAVHLFDFATQMLDAERSSVPLYSTTNPVNAVDIHGDVVVWDERIGGAWEIRVCALSGSPPACTPVTNVHAGDDEHPRVFNGTVAYRKTVLPGVTEVWTFSAATPGTSNVRLEAAPASRVSIFRDMVAWNDPAGSTGRIKRIGSGGASTLLGTMYSAPALAGAGSGPTDLWAMFRSSAGPSNHIQRVIEPFSGAAAALTQELQPHGDPDAHRSGQRLQVVATTFQYGPEGLLLLDRDETTSVRTWSDVLVPGRRTFLPAVTQQRVVFGLEDSSASRAIATLDRGWLVPTSPSGFTQEWPRVAQGKLAWIDFRHSPTGDVYVLDRSSGKVQVLTDRMPAGFTRRALSFDGRIAAWQEKTNGLEERKVAWVDSASPQPPVVAATCTSNPGGCEPQVYARRIVWSEGSATNNNVVELNTANGMRGTVAGTAFSEDTPAIGPGATAGSVRYAWIEDGVTVRYQELGGPVQCAAGCTGATPSRFTPAVAGDRIAWVQANRVWLYENGAARELVPGSTSRQSAPSLGGDTLVYLDDASNSPAAHAYDLLSRTHARVLTRPDAIPQAFPHTDGSSVVFTDFSGGTHNVIWSLNR